MSSESEFQRPMPEHGYFLEASHFNMDLKKKKKGICSLEKSKCDTPRKELAWYGSKSKNPCLLGSEGV